jgi:hypothetical protein
MNIKLPQPIANYFQAANAQNPEGVANTFASDSVVVDESREHHGAAAIRAWNKEVNEKYQPHAEPVDLAVENETAVVTTDVSGTFDGSPVRLRFNFTLAGDRIARLQIEA